MTSLEFVRIETVVAMIVSAVMGSSQTDAGEAGGLRYINESDDMSLGISQLKGLILTEQNKTSSNSSASVGDVGNGGEIEDVAVLPIDGWVDAARNAGMNPLGFMLIRRAAKVDALY